MHTGHVALGGEAFEWNGKPIAALSVSIYTRRRSRLAASFQVLAAERMAAVRNPELGHDPILIIGAIVKALVVLSYCIDFGWRSLADATAEYDVSQ